MTDSFDLAATMRRLATARPVFHKEADFQFALAWQIQQDHPAYRIRLETRMPTREVHPTTGRLRREHLDLLIADADGRRLAIELKYLPPNVVGEVPSDVGTEPFDVPDGGAEDVGSYAFLKDVYRLERFAADNPGLRGTAILLTGKPMFWRRKARAAETNFDQFRIFEGARLSGALNWHAKAAEKTRQAHPPLELRGAYECRWMPYSEALGHEWRYLALDVPASRPEPGSLAGTSA